MMSRGKPYSPRELNSLRTGNEQNGKRDAVHDNIYAVGCIALMVAVNLLMALSLEGCANLLQMMGIR